MNCVTAEDVKMGMMFGSITRVNHHDCGGCGQWTFYQRQGDQLFYHSACGCVSYESPPRNVGWDDAANWINMQTNEEVRKTLASKFGITSS